MKNTIRYTLITLAASPLFSAVTHAAAVAANWSAGAAGPVLSDASGTGLSVAGANMNSGFMTSLTTAGTPYSLGSVGDALTLTGTITPGGTLATVSGHPGSIRLGLYDDGGSADTKGWSGYFLLLDTAGSAGTDGGLYERNGAAQDFWSGTSATRLTTYASSEAAFISGSEYAFTFTLTKTIAGVRLDSLVYDKSAPGRIFLDSSQEDTTGALSSFNRVGFYAGTGLGADTLAISSLDVKLAAVPEPGAWAAITAGLIPVVAAARRRRNRADRA